MPVSFLFNRRIGRRIIAQVSCDYLGFVPILAAQTKKAAEDSLSGGEDMFAKKTSNPHYHGQRGAGELPDAGRYGDTGSHAQSHL